ncbi:DUF1848 domain-containing protein [Methanoculleus sp. CWC-02]|uniref:DUF1848 domain-containing protein n=1 Tax=Methanoculleus oceani TaxID=2184756 RepID=A0ABD4TBH1_9EURY|nr:DUF1848 domain-containing protein [Methanoculleus sp. CWC-02]
MSPPILSVSRSTDIPAFYSEWFIERLHKGYSVWLNPMNQKPQVINFENAKFIVFWTKNASSMLKHLSDIDNMDIRYYFQYAVNNYEREGFESNLPPLSERIASFIELSKVIGKEKVIWRFDPLILSNDITIDSLLENVKTVGDALHQYTEKLVISFVDINPYTRVRNNLNNANYEDVREFTENEMRMFSEKLAQMNEEWGLQISTCGEIIDLSDFDIMHNRCIDPELIRRICSDMPAFLTYINEHSNKDKGQRNSCGCIPSKDIGQYNTCMHQCTYCYANHFSKTVENNYQSHLKSIDSPTINGSNSWERYFLNEKTEQLSFDRF